MPQNNQPNMNGRPAGGPGGPGRPGGGGGGRGAAQGKIRFTPGTGKSLKRLFSFIRGKYLVMFIIALCMMGIASLVSVKASLFMKTLIDDYISPMVLTGSHDFSPLLKELLTLACIYALGIAASLCNSLLMANMSQGVLMNVRVALFEKLQTLPVAYYHSHQYGDIMSRFTNDVNNMRQMLSQSIPSVLSSLLTIVAVLYSMIRISPTLTLVQLVAVVFMYVITITLGTRSAMFFTKRQRALGEMNSYIEELINGQKVVKVFCYEERAKKSFDGRNSSLQETTTRANILSNILMPIMGNMSNVTYVVLAFIGGVLAIKGKSALTLGGLASFLSLSKSFNRPVSQISPQINSVVMALAGAQRVFDVMDEKPETDEGEVTLVYAKEAEDGTLTETDSFEGIWAWKEPGALGTGSTLTRLRGDVRLQDVDFSYEEGHQILYDISLYAKPGQKIAFVGSTGAGKTTITNLINRFYDIQDGTITYDGIDIKRIRKKDLRTSLGMVLQETRLFTGTIMENIRYGRLDATDEEVIAAAKLADAHSFIEKLPEGYNTVISGSGSQLSQGQCQLLSIARCAVANPPVMILDEATSSIDIRTEAQIQKGMDQLMHGRTVFVIAHRLSTVQNSNAIMVLENGHIIERGDHDDLIAQQGRYYQLYTGTTPANG
ncbi:MAG: ABC transporter ATP-binding protein [Firmicutes bacterium]|nr:ABC transporter ATP-binding protein [Bacillota bacterium]